MISTPSWEIGEPSGPIENGTTYMVRPRIEPRKSSTSSAFIAAGSRQLLVGPASSAFSEQMKVRSSTRATSLGLERARNELGRSAGLSRVKVPVETRSSVSRVHSSSEPSHHSMRVGLREPGDLFDPLQQLLVGGGRFGEPGDRHVINPLCDGSLQRAGRRPTVLRVHHARRFGYSRMGIGASKRPAL